MTAATNYVLDPLVLFLEDLSKEITSDDLQCLKRVCLSSGIVVSGDDTENISAGDLFLKLHQKGLTLPGNNDLFISLLRAIPREDLIKKFQRFLATASFERTKYPSLVIKEVSDYLRSFYRSRLSEVQPLPWCHDFFLPLNDVYTNLQFTEKDRRGRSSEPFPLQVSQLFETIMGSARMPRRVRVEGSPGIGKSTFCHKILYEWACGILPQFSAAFLLVMRDFSGSIAHAIFEQLPEEYKCKFNQEELWAQLLNGSKDLLFVVDGIDEIDAETLASSDLNKLNQGKTMYESTVVVTSRPHEFEAILKFCHPNLRITGYTSTNRDNFIRQYFDVRNNTAENLIKQIQSKHILSEICQTPLNTILLCVLWEENAGNLPSTITDLYADLVLAITKSYYANREGVDIDGDTLPDNAMDKLLKLGEYACHGLKENRLVFRQSETLPDELLLSGFLTKSVGLSRIKRSKTCNFLHKTFQEYFAGFYITSKIKRGDEVTSDMRTLVEKELFVVCLFVSGLLKGDSELLFRELAETLEREKPNQKKFERILLCCLSCLRESGSGELLAPIVARSLPPKLNLESYSYFSFADAEYEQRQTENGPVTLHLDNQTINGLHYLLSCCPESDSENPGGCSVRGLIMGNRFEPELSADVLSHLTENSPIESLNVNVLHDTLQTDALSSAVKRSANIIDVTLNFAYMGNIDSVDKIATIMCVTVEKLSESLKCNSKRDKFRLVLHLLAPVIPFPTLPLELFKSAPLKELEIQIHSMATLPQTTLIDSFTEIVRSNTNLRKLSFLLGGIPPKFDIDFTSLGNALEQNCTLVCFKLWCLDLQPVPIVSCPDVMSVFQALDSNTSLREFSVTIGEQNDGICNVLQRNGTLSCLTLFFANDVGEFVLSVLRALERHRTLDTLRMRYGGPMSCEVLKCLSNMIICKDGVALKAVHWDSVTHRSFQVTLSALENFRDSVRDNERLQELSLPPITCSENEYPRFADVVMQIQRDTRQRLRDLNIMVMPPPEKKVTSPPSAHVVKVYGPDKSKGPAFTVNDRVLDANEDVLETMSETERSSLINMIKKYHMAVIEVPEHIKNKYFN